MNNLFDEMYMGFFEDNQVALIQEKQQKYYDYLAELISKGEGFLPSLDPDADPSDFVDRKLTKYEIIQLTTKIKKWMKTLN